MESAEKGSEPRPASVWPFPTPLLMSSSFNINDCPFGHMYVLLFTRRWHFPIHILYCFIQTCFLYILPYARSPCSRPPLCQCVHGLIFPRGQDFQRGNLCILRGPASDWKTRTPSLLLAPPFQLGNPGISLLILPMISFFFFLSSPSLCFFVLLSHYQRRLPLFIACPFIHSAARLYLPASLREYPP